MANLTRRPIDWTVGLPSQYFPGCEALTEGTHNMDAVGRWRALRLYPREYGVLSAAGSQGLGLESREHGLLLCESDDDVRWTLIVSSVRRTHSVRRGWPEDWK